MRRIMVATLALAGTMAAAAAQPKRPLETKQVHAQGCVEPGVEAGCLLVRDVKSDILYNLLMKGIRPAPGTGIEFTGVPHNGVTTCMQGVALDVLSWARRESVRCTPGQMRRQ